MREVKMESIRVLDRAIAIIKTFDLDCTQLSLDEISKKTKLPSSTVYRILCSLEKRGVVQFNENSATYQLGLQLVEFGILASSNYKIQQVAEEDLNLLQNKSKQTVIMAVKIEDEILYVYSKENPQGLKYSTSTGRRRPITFGLLGPVLLAFSPQSQIDRVLNLPIPPHTPYTITDKQEWYQILEGIRKDKFYIDINLTTIGVAGVAAPIFGVDDKVVASVGVMGPLFQVEEKLDEFKLLLSETVKQISHKIKFND
ncbi:IclR family transcriptional regulator [Bacillus sp. X1(2014)]|uniref:IclR family transcriptional regulator n=1 Tax=Bacillus sp. X1(2014) TaxID=1565991 RepID=UPI0011A8FCB8|nr:IclR family transcriptional regulator [Bacillus sp. X1(2014)]